MNTESPENPRGSWLEYAMPLGAVAGRLGTIIPEMEALGFEFERIGCLASLKQPWHAEVDAGQIIYRQFRVLSS